MGAGFKFESEARRGEVNERVRILKCCGRNRTPPHPVTDRAGLAVVVEQLFEAFESGTMLCRFDHAESSEVTTGLLRRACFSASELAFARASRINVLLFVDPRTADSS